MTLTLGMSLVPPAVWSLFLRSKENTVPTTSYATEPMTKVCSQPPRWQSGFKYLTVEEKTASEQPKISHQVPALTL